MKFFLPAKNVTLELKKMGSPSKAQCMYKKEQNVDNPAKSVAAWEQKRHCAAIAISNANLHLQKRWVLPALQIYIDINPPKWH